MNRRYMLPSAGLLLVGAAIGHFAHTARAGGIPGSQTLTYAGVLQNEKGQPLSGRQAIDFRLWDERENGAERCGLLNPSGGYVLTVDGRFSIPLPDACVRAVSDYPQLWVELRVAGSALPRAPLGAVPYAVEARRAVSADSASGALEQRIAALEASKGKVAGIWFGSVAADGACATINNSPWIDVPDATVTFTVDKPITIWTTYSINVNPDLAPNAEHVATHLVVDDVVAEASGSHYQPFSGGDSNVNLNGNYVVDLGSGTHTVKLQWATAGGIERTWASCPAWAIGGASVAGRNVSVVGVYR